jgi:hypothetical protein
MGIRSFGLGRVGLLAMWDGFLFGCGEKFLYNNEILVEGIKGKKSDFGRLLQNTLRWLAEPSVSNATSELGGYVTTPDVLIWPNEKPEVAAAYKDAHYPYNKAALVGDPAANDGSRVFKGLIGAQSVHGGSGTSTVEDYATAAASAGLDFVAFLDPHRGLNNASWTALKAECKRLSSSTLKLYAGYTIQTNIGDHYFAYGPEPGTLPARDPADKCDGLLDSKGKLRVQTSQPDASDPNCVAESTGTSGHANYSGQSPAATASYILAPCQGDAADPGEKIID